ncbi:MAG: GTP-binding protein [Promethearchaeota archaeon]|nr:MAG: GTP-binding protein [Candidatus Lokiarchaeota archaeon]
MSYSSQKKEEAKRGADALFKIIIFGDGGVGKTTLVRRYLEGYFEETTKMTVGMDFFVKHVEVEGKQVTLQIWDFGGEERFRFLLPSYVSGASGGIFMYDITRLMSLNHIDDWLEIFSSEYSKKYSEETLPVIMVGGKKDLAYKRSVKKEEAKQVKEEQNCYKHMECSSKTGENVEDVFKELTRELLRRIDML